MPREVNQSLHLLRRCIWGIERNSDACHVAAFSLYLTMLDYVDRKEILGLLAKAGHPKVFPTLVGRNILVRDFFDDAIIPSHNAAKYSVILTNPPWKKASAIGKLAADYAKGDRQHHGSRPCGATFSLAMLRPLSSG